MRIRRAARLLAVIASSGLLITACGSLDSTGNGGGGASGATSAASASSGGTATIKVGYVSPQTGPLAAFGEADKFVVDQMTTYFKDHPISAGGKSYTVEIILKDAQSDSKRASEVAADLINNDGVT